MARSWESTDEDFFTFPLSGTSNGCCDTTGTGVNNNVDMIGFGGGIGLSGQVGRGWFTKHIEWNEGTNDAVEVTPSFISVAFPKIRIHLSLWLKRQAMDCRYLLGWRGGAARLHREA
jgi:hypothetical protein